VQGSDQPTSDAGGRDYESRISAMVAGPAGDQAVQLNCEPADHAKCIDSPRKKKKNSRSALRVRQYSSMMTRRRACHTMQTCTKSVGAYQYVGHELAVTRGFA